MSDTTLKVTVKHGKEDDFIKFCAVHGIYYKQYPSPITWAFRVEPSEHEANPKYKLSLLSYVKAIELMPVASLDNN